jgi:Na+/phosphate symporter
LDPDSRKPSDVTSYLAWSHLIFNILLSMVFLPFTQQFTALVCQLIPGKDIDDAAQKKKADSKAAANSSKPAKR